MSSKTPNSEAGGLPGVSAASLAFLRGLDSETGSDGGYSGSAYRFPTEGSDAGVSPMPLHYGIPSEADGHHEDDYTTDELAKQIAAEHQTTLREQLLVDELSEMQNMLTNMGENLRLSEQEHGTLASQLQAALYEVNRSHQHTPVDHEQRQEELKELDTLRRENAVLKHEVHRLRKQQDQMRPLTPSNAGGEVGERTSPMEQPRDIRQAEVLVIPSNEKSSGAAKEASGLPQAIVVAEDGEDVPAASVFDEVVELQAKIDQLRFENRSRDLAFRANEAKLWMMVKFRMRQLEHVSAMLAEVQANNVGDLAKRVIALRENLGVAVAPQRRKSHSVDSESRRASEYSMSRSAIRPGTVYSPTRGPSQSQSRAPAAKSRPTRSTASVASAASPEKYKRASTVTDIRLREKGWK